MSESARVASMRGAHEVISRVGFEVAPIEKGYANRYLRVDLSTGAIAVHPVDQRMKDLWTGGKGFDLWLMFLEINKNTRWDSPENPICFATGPLGGTTSFPGSGKTLLTTISPLTNIVIDSNVGGYFGPYLKFAGFDALVITGKSAREAMILVDAEGGTISIETCPKESLDSHLVAEEFTAMYAKDELDRRNVSVVSAGRGADHTFMGLLNFSFWDWRRGVARLKQAGRGGVGTVFRNKNLKALVVRNRDITPSWRVAENKVAHLTASRGSLRELPPRPLQRSESACAGNTTPKTVTACDCSAEIAAIAQKWGNDREYVIEMMQDVQDRFRHIPKNAIDEIARATGAPRAQLYHIATFYKAFSLTPRGETTIQVCMGTACHVKGAARILDSFERVLNVQAGGTTADNKYSLEAVACVGACSIAPVVRIGDEVHGNVEARHVERLISSAASQKQSAISLQPGVRSPESVDGRSEVGSQRSEVRADASRLKTQDSGLGSSSSAFIPHPSSSILDDVSSLTRARLGSYHGMLMVCTGTGCVAAKGFDLRDEVRKAVADRGLDKEWLVVSTGCNGFCAMGPIIVVQPEGVFYERVKPADFSEIIESHLLGGKPVERLLHKDPASGAVERTLREMRFFSKQQLIALRNKGLIDPEEIDHYIARDGYKALRKVLNTMEPDAVISDVIASGIRGRGGGGFPAGVKWRSGRKAAIERKEDIFVVCNGDEGDPGAFMDRSIIETDPHSVIEGMAIGAYAVGAHEGFVYIRKEYPLAQHRLAIAIEQAREKGILGKNVLGTGFSFDIHVHRGAGAFVCGESTALMASMMGRPGEPRAKYVHNVEYGFRDKPTVLNNVETWATIPVIMDKGAAWFAGIGTGGVAPRFFEDPWGGSSGTKVFSLVGKIRNTGLVEVPMGITLREIIFDIGGGIPGGRKFKAVQTGGPSGGCLPESLLDMPVDFDSLTAAGSMMGSGGMIVMDDRTCMVDVARYFVNFLVDESCGKCTPCREGLFALNEVLSRICRGEGRLEDIPFLEELSQTVRDTSLCQLGGSAPNPVLSTIRYFKDEYERHIKDKKCPAGVCKSLISYGINDKCNGCGACVKPCPSAAITGEKKALHAIDAQKCIKCGICREACRFEAIEVG